MLAPLDPALGPDARVLAALARTRALGLHFLGHFLGVGAVANGGGESRLVLEPPDGPGGGVAGSPTELAVLADLAMGSAIRSDLGPGLRLGTTALTIDHLRPPAPGRLEAHAVIAWTDPATGDGHATCRVVDRTGALVATASGWFVVLPPLPGRALPPVPWEGPVTTVPDLTVADLDETETETLASVRRATARAADRGGSVAAALVTPASGERGDAGGRLGAGPALGNRVGQMQGGALYGTAATAAAALLGGGWAVTAGHLQFLRPAAAGAAAVSARVLRQGRRAAYTEAEVATERGVAVAGRFTHRPVTPR